MVMRSGGLLGLQTVVVKNGRVVWMKSYGYAVLDQSGPRRPMSNDSILFSVCNPAWPGVPITWRMLFTHISSLNEEDDEHLSSTLFYGKDPDTTLDEVVEQSLAHGGSRHWPDQWRRGKPGTFGSKHHVTVDCSGRDWPSEQQN